MKATITRLASGTVYHAKVKSYAIDTIGKEGRDAIRSLLGPEIVVEFRPGRIEFVTTDLRQATDVAFLICKGIDDAEGLVEAKNRAFRAELAERDRARTIGRIA